MAQEDLNTSAGCLQEAEKWESVVKASIPGDPSKRLAELNVEFFLDTAVKLEKEGK